MRKFYFLHVFSILSFLEIHAQAPQLMSYQAVIRNGNNVLVSNAPVSMRISILQGSTSGSLVYSEIHNTTTNANGLAMISIGGGTVQSGTFAGINWANGPYFVQSETDPNGGTNYSIVATSQLMSVPYALYAKNGFQNGTAAGQMMYWNGSAWVVVAPGTNEQTLSYCDGVPTWGPCLGNASFYPVGSVFCTAGPTFVLNVTNPTTGKIWMDRNLGAVQVATNSTDAAAYGDLYQWGRRSDGHQCRTSASTTMLSSIDQPGHGAFIVSQNTPYDWRSPQYDNLWQGVNGVNNPCPSSYRLPTSSELDAERLSWSVNTSIGALTSPLKLPVAGKRDYSNGVNYSVSSDGFYWSSTVNGIYSASLNVYSGSAESSINARAGGLSVRCLKD